MKIRAFVFVDRDYLRDFLKRAVERRGIEVFTFSHPTTCEECPCLPNQVCADIILSEVHMPRLTGVNFLAQQHRQGCKITTNTALMSGNWSDAELQRCQALGYHVFSMPFELAEMDQWLDECETRIDPNRQLDSFFQDEWHRQQLEEHP